MATVAVQLEMARRVIACVLLRPTTIRTPRETGKAKPGHELENFPHLVFERLSIGSRTDPGGKRLRPGHRGQGRKSLAEGLIAECKAITDGLHGLGKPDVSRRNRICSLTATADSPTVCSGPKGGARRSARERQRTQAMLPSLRPRSLTLPRRFSQHPAWAIWHYSRTQ